MRLSRPFEVITATVDGDVLMVLARAEGPFSGRQVQRLTRERSVTGVHKSLKRLAEQGVVLRQRVGRTDLYRLNPDHVAADAIKAIARLPEKVFDLMRRELSAWVCKPSCAAVFGSVARGEERPDSDIDVLLVRPENADLEAWRLAVSGFMDTLSKATGNDVRVLDLTADELRRPENDALLAELRRDAVHLMGESVALTRRGA